MRRISQLFLCLLLCCMLLIGCTQSQQNKTTPTTSDQLAIFEQGLIEEEKGDLKQFNTATQYELQLSLEQPYSELGGQEKVTYWNNEDVALNEIYLRMFPNNSGDCMVVSKILVDGQETSINVEFDNSALRVDLPAALEPGNSVVLELSYTIQIPSDYGGNYGLFSYIDGILALDEVYAVIPVYDDEGWNVEIPPKNGDMIYADPSFFTVTIDAPVELLIASSGTVIDEQESDGMQTQTVIAGPVRDFYLAASAKYEAVSEQVGETLVTSYYPEGYEEGGEFVLQSGVKALNTYNELFGTYPYTELDMVGTPMQAGGMEYSGIVAVGAQYYDPNTIVAGTSAFTFLEMAAAHEVAHEWFFNMVMDDQIDEPWIDEGMAQYLTQLYYEYNYGSSAARSFKESLYSRWERVNNRAIPIGMPVSDYTETEYGAIIYGRAPLFIQSLRDKMGDEVFFEFLKNLFTEYKWGILNTEEFRAVAEESCGCDLQEEFDTWVY